jgi:hypothetical protein
LGGLDILPERHSIQSVPPSQQFLAQGRPSKAYPIVASVGRVAYCQGDMAYRLAGFVQGNDLGWINLHFLVLRRCAHFDCQFLFHFPFPPGLSGQMTTMEENWRTCRGKVQKKPEYNKQGSSRRSLVVGQKYVVAVKTPSGKMVKVFDVCIKGSNVYLNYSDASTPEYHKSYHSSGQQHFKIGGKYVEWTGGISGQMEPMKLIRELPAKVTGRSDFCTIGWKIFQLEQALPMLQESSAMTIDAHNIDSDNVCFHIDVIGDEARNPTSMLGFPIFASQQFGTGAPRIEIFAFAITSEQEIESAVALRGQLR